MFSIDRPNASFIKLHENDSVGLDMVYPSVVALSVRIVIDDNAVPGLHLSPPNITHATTPAISNIVTPAHRSDMSFNEGMAYLQFCPWVRPIDCSEGVLYRGDDLVIVLRYDAQGN